MRSPRSALLLVPVLLAGAMPARAQPPTCQAGVTRLELPATLAAPTELCIHPSRYTTLVFDAPLATGGVELEGREHFRRVEGSDKVLLLVPSERLPPGARLELQVHFAEGQVPPSARFTLVAHPELAAQVVEVSHAPAPASASADQTRRLEEQLQQCEARVASLSSQSTDALALVHAVISGKLDDTGMASQLLKKGDFAQGPGESVELQNLTLYRSRRALALKVRVKNAAANKPWVLEGATLLGSTGEAVQTVAVFPREPLAPGATETRWIEWAMPPSKDKDKEPSSYTLHLWDAGKARTATVPGLKLP
ncbi:MAG TPA: DUF2381 family protein [Myxococcaceae bacterium]|jgi:uncharacterized protein (TIGR02268 family)